ncbi:T9SS type A sorting domain-containing protein [Segetibacter sp. 3557_3]|uniref:T9SS type A sorting domain-containing protein n=1 Tax=Segetibacter sp. 3557_3 TaxID=2547429 RepID=UPI00105889CC|nr:T9SS type A sorting domain-containing protein [Segetibacter sp. 3557_3]TDH29105.1 T9SS type A sorting domain-containing protein [Segetibacter sp. 3557_3]
MKKIFTLTLLPAFLLFASFTASAQIYWDFATANPTSNSYTNVSAGPLTVGNNNGTTTLITNTSPSSGYSGASGGNNAGLAAPVVGFDPAQTGYFQVVITPMGNNSVVLTGISFGSNSAATGPQGVTIRSSVDNFSTDRLTFILTNNNTWMRYAGDLNLTGLAGQPVTLRIFGYNGAGTATAGTANWRIDDLTINPQPLPLGLVSFKASLNGKVAQLNWNTTNEYNVSGFSVERSQNAARFSEIAFVNAKNSTATNIYTLDDAGVQDGTNYYRLRMVDKDGTAKYSPVVVVKNAKVLSASVFPNPTKGNLAITHPKAESNSFIRIIDLEGKQVKSYAVEAGAIQTALSVSELSRGSYVLVFNNNGNHSATRFVKQ